MKAFKTIEQTKSEIRELSEHVHLVESFEPKTLVDIIIKNYAYTGNLAKVAKTINEMGYSNNGVPFTKEDISGTIRSNPSSQVHKVIRSGFLKKTRHTRLKTEKYIWYK